MKKGHLLMLLAIAFSLGAGQSAGQFRWTKDVRNPILSGGGTGAWDTDTGVPWVIFNPDSGRYEMWYTGSSLQIGFAVSPDGISWQKDATPVLSATAHAWDSLGVAASCVIREGSTFKMWYTGVHGPAPGGIGIGATRIGYATSTDGRHWSKHAGNPVLAAGSRDWETGGVAYCSVVKSLGGYQMFYTGSSAAGLAVICRATSVDGITWQRDTVSNPVLKAAPAGAWDRQLFLPAVVADSGVYSMWYTAEATAGDGHAQIGLATSIDSGRTWTRYGSAPVVPRGSSGSWDETGVELGSVLLRGGTYQMWYDGVNSPTYLPRIGYAISPRLARPTSGEWEAPTEFGKLGFTVNATGTKITKLIFDARNWACGPVSGSWTVTTYYTNPLLGWPIGNHQFAITHTRTSYPYNEVYTVQGTFDSTGRRASGTWAYDVGGTICAGSWGPVGPVVVVRDDDHAPERFVLHQNYPNPFNPITTITYELPRASDVRMSVYDLLGREVSTLVHQRQDAGVHEVRFDGSNLSSGVYICRLRAGDFVQAMKIVIAK